MLDFSKSKQIGAWRELAIKQVEEAGIGSVEDINSWTDTDLWQWAVEELKCAEMTGEFDGITQDMITEIFEVMSDEEAEVWAEDIEAYDARGALLAEIWAKSCGFEWTK